MNTLWRMRDHPLWLHHAFLSGQIGGLADTGSDGGLTINWAIHPQQTVVSWTRLLIPQDSPFMLEQPIRTEEAFFRVDHEKRVLEFTRSLVHVHEPQAQTG